MKRYLLSYLAAYVASLAAFGVIMVIAISNWFFTDSPLWFDVLGVIVTALPALALGEVLGRRFKASRKASARLADPAGNHGNTGVYNRTPRVSIYRLLAWFADWQRAADSFRC